MSIRFVFFYSLYFFTLCFYAKNIPSIHNLTLDQKIGQLFMVAAVVDEEIAHEVIEKKPYRMDKEYIEQLIKEYHIGGIIFLGKSDYLKQIERTQHFQNLSTIPLLIGQDLEPGRVGAARFDDFSHFPNNQQLGLLDDIAYTHHIGKAIGAIAKSIGMDIVFAPVADINNNPHNPVINDRSFGENPELVVKHTIAFVNGLQEMNVIACAKHFPGHGDTNMDSHYDLPIIAHTRERLDTIELVPFRELIDQKIPVIMIAHLAVPTLQNDERENIPATLSKDIVTDLLRNELGFSGLIITDALDMKGITNYYTDGDAELHALLAGNDILLCPVDVPLAINKIKKAIDNGIITEETIDEHVEKILEIKNMLYN